MQKFNMVWKFSLVVLLAIAIFKLPSSFNVTINEEINSVESKPISLQANTSSDDGVSKCSTYEATAYARCFGDSCKTRIGLKPFYDRTARRGVVAVDPAFIPLRSIVWVEGYGYAIAADTGSAIKGKRIDVWFDSMSRAKNWGRKSVEVCRIKLAPDGPDRLADFARQY